MPLARPGPPNARALRGLVLSAVLAGAVALAYGATRSALLDVDVVRVEGGARTEAADVVQAGGLGSHPQLADVDPQDVAERIERLPWVHTARVTRHWPRSVEVMLQERSPVAALSVQGGAPPGWALVDGTGRVLEHVGEVPQGMATIDGPGKVGSPGQQVPAVSRPAIGVLERLTPALQERVTALRVAQDGSLELSLSGAPPVLFGPPAQVQAKLVAVETLLARASLRGVTAVDVRVPTAPVLTRG